jgi:hypothetical protein
MQIGLSGWIIQDGNYPDFEVGQLARFALEFFAHSLQSAVLAKRISQLTKPSLYNVEGTVVFSAKDAWVMDCGFLAYSPHTPPAFAVPGAGIKGEVYVGIDPFFYFEDLCKIRGMPELRSDWRINSILLETTPWRVGHDAFGREMMERDESQTSYKTVERTDAWNDDKWGAHYILDCTMNATH